MHSTDTKSQFLELRAKGWSLARIAERLSVGQRTLVDWNRQHRSELAILRAVEVEALQEKILASHESELSRLTHHLNRIEDALAERKLSCLDTETLFKLAARLRVELREVQLDPDPAAIPPVPTPPAS